MRLGTIVAAMAAVVPLGAQQVSGDRAPVRGTVLDLAAVPWRGASIVLVSSPSSESTWARDIDRVEVRPDARGRFRADILADRSYAVWATQDVDDLVYRVSRVAGNVTAGTLIRLVESPRRHVRGAFCLEGVEGWRGAGTARAFLISSVHGDVPGALLRLTAELEVAADGTGRLPRWPATAASLQVLTRRGAWPGRATLDLSHDHLRNLIKARTHGDGSPAEVFTRSATLRLAPPATALLEVMADDGHVSDARVFLRWRDGGFLLGATDARGRCRVHLPMKSGQKRIQVGVAGYGLGVRTIAPSFVPGVEVPIEKLRPTLVQIERGQALTGRVMIGDGPARNMQFLFYGQCGATHVNDFAPSLLKTDADGRFSVTCLRPGSRYSIRAMPRPEHVRRLGVPDKEHVASPMLVAVGQLPQADRDLGEIRIDELPRVTLQLAEADGLPADRATIVVEHKRTRAPFSAFRVAGDKRGRVTLIVPPAIEMVVHAGWRGGYATTTFRTPRSGTRLVRAVGAESRTVMGRVVDAAGAPVAHAAITGRPSGSAKHAFLRSAEVWSDAEGRFELRLPVAEESWSVTAKSFVDGLPVGVEGGARRLEPGDGAGELDLVLTDR